VLGVDIDTPLSESERDALIESIATAIVRRRLETPAILFLETHKPLSFIASQSALVAIPFLGPFIGAQRMADLSKLLRDRANIDALVARIEDMAAAETATQVEH
jgi:hypothetical protein